MLIKKDLEDVWVSFVVWGLNFGLFVCFGVFGFTLKKPNFKEVHPNLRHSKIPGTPLLAACVFWGTPRAHSQHFCPRQLVPSCFPWNRRSGKAEQLPLLGLCLLWFCLLGIQGMQKSIRKKEPNRSLVFVHDLRRAKEASQNQMVSFSPRENSSSECPPAQPAGAPGPAGERLSELKALK